MVPDQPASSDPASARSAGCEISGPLCLLRHYGELHATLPVPPSGHQNMAEMVGTSGAREISPLGEIPADSGAPSAPQAQDHAPLRHGQRSSLMRNRMQ